MSLLATSMPSFVHMRTELKGLHERFKTTAIYITHDQVEAITLGTRIMVIFIKSF